MTAKDIRDVQGYGPRLILCSSFENEGWKCCTCYRTSTHRLMFVTMHVWPIAKH